MYSIFLGPIEVTRRHTRETLRRRHHGAVVGLPAVFALAGAAMLALAALHAEPSVAHPATAAPPQAERRADAVEAFRSGQYAVAYGRYAELADAGDVAAAQVALVMLRNGPALFGSAWSATPGQQAHWTTLVVEGARRQAPIPGGEPRE